MSGEFLGNSNDSLQAFSEKLRREDIANYGLTEERMDAQQIEAMDVTRQGPDDTDTISPTDCNEVNIKMIDDKDVILVVESSQEDENTSCIGKGATKTKSKKNAVRCTSNKHGDGSSSQPDKQPAHQVADKRKGSLCGEDNVTPPQKRIRKVASKKQAIEVVKKRQRSKVDQNTKLPNSFNSRKGPDLNCFMYRFRNYIRPS